MLKEVKKEGQSAYCWKYWKSIEVLDVNTSMELEDITFVWEILKVAYILKKNSPYSAMVVNVLIMFGLLHIQTVGEIA